MSNSFRVIKKTNNKPVTAEGIAGYYFGKLQKWDTNLYFFVIKQDGLLYIVKEGHYIEFKKVNKDKYVVEWL